MSPEHALLLFDEDCGFCRWATDRILAWDTAGRLRAIALGSPDAGELLASMPPERRMASWHLVGDRGEVHSAGRAVAPLLRLLPGGAPFAILAVSFPRATDTAYAWIARHRGLLGWLLGERACSVRPDASQTVARKGPGE